MAKRYCYLYPVAGEDELPSVQRLPGAMAELVYSDAASLQLAVCRWKKVAEDSEVYVWRDKPPQGTAGPPEAWVELREDMELSDIPAVQADRPLHIAYVKAPAAPIVDARGRFEQSLSDAGMKTPDQGILDICYCDYSSRVMLNPSPDQALAIYKAAARKPATSTSAHLKEEYQLQLNGIYGAAHSGKATFMVAFEEGRPKLLKVASDDNDTLREAEVWKKLQDHAHDPKLHNLVGPIRHVKFHAAQRVSSASGRARNSGIVMPIYITTLEHLPTLNEELGCKVLEQITRALSSLHSVGFCHSDVKPSNIFMDMEGDYYLGDYGACVQDGEQLHESSPAYWPKDVNNRFASFSKDFYLLAVTVMSKLSDCVDIDSSAITTRAPRLTELRDKVSKMGADKQLARMLSPLLN